MHHIFLQEPTFWVTVWVGPITKKIVGFITKNFGCQKIPEQPKPMEDMSQKDEYSNL